MQRAPTGRHLLHFGHHSFLGLLAFTHKHVEAPQAVLENRVLRRHIDILSRRGIVHGASGLADVPQRLDLVAHNVKTRGQKEVRMNYIHEIILITRAWSPERVLLELSLNQQQMLYYDSVKIFKSQKRIIKPKKIIIKQEQILASQIAPIISSHLVNYTNKLNVDLDYVETRLLRQQLRRSRPSRGRC